MATRNKSESFAITSTLSNETTCRDDLIAAAINLFAERGFQGTSIRNIADELGLSVSNIYHHFGNKEGLWLAILEHSVKDLPRKLLEAVESAGDDPVERFRSLLAAHLKLSIEHQKESQIFFIDQSMLSPDGVKVNRTLQKNVFDIYVSELKNLRDAGKAAADNIKITALNVLALVNWHLRWYRKGGPVSAEAAHQYIVDFALAGVLARPDSR